MPEKEANASSVITLILLLEFRTDRFEDIEMDWFYALIEMLI